jgi:hypothetical protein
MTAMLHCWWLTLDNLTPGTQTFEYFLYSKRDGGDFLCDPYSESVLEKGVDNNFPKGGSKPLRIRNQYYSAEILLASFRL